MIKTTKEYEEKLTEEWIEKNYPVLAYGINCQKTVCDKFIIRARKNVRIYDYIIEEGTLMMCKSVIPSVAEIILKIYVPSESTEYVSDLDICLKINNDVLKFPFNTSGSEIYYMGMRSASNFDEVFEIITDKRDYEESFKLINLLNLSEMEISEYNKTKHGQIVVCNISIGLLIVLDFASLIIFGPNRLLLIPILFAMVILLFEIKLILKSNYYENSENGIKLSSEIKWLSHKFRNID